MDILQGGHPNMKWNSSIFKYIFEDFSSFFKYFHKTSSTTRVEKPSIFKYIWYWVSTFYRVTHYQQTRNKGLKSVTKYVAFILGFGVFRKLNKVPTRISISSFLLVLIDYFVLEGVCWLLGYILSLQDYYRTFGSSDSKLLSPKSSVETLQFDPNLER